MLSKDDRPITSASHEAQPVDPTAIQRRAVRGSVWAVVDQVFRTALGVVTTLVVAAYVGPDEFGIIAVALSVEGLLVVLRTGGFSASLIQRKDVTDSQINTALWISLLICGGLVTGLAVAARPLARFYDQPRLAPILWVLILPIMAQAIGSIQDALLRKQLRFGRLLVANSGSAAVASVVAIVSALLGAGIWALVLRIVVGRLLAASACWLLSTWRPKLQLSREAARSLWVFGGYVFLTALLNYGKNQLDGPIIGKLIGLAAAGMFLMARQLALSSIEQIVGALGHVMFAVFSAVQRDLATLRSGYLTGARCLSVLIFPIIASIVAISPDAVPLVLADEWHPITPIVQVISLQAIVYCTNAGIAPILLARGRSGLLLALSIFRTALTVSSFVIGCHWGILGVAIASTIAAFAWSPIGLWFACAEVELRMIEVVRHVCRPVIAALAAVVAVRGVAWAWIAGGGSLSMTLVLLEFVVGLGVFAALTAIYDIDIVHKIKNDLLHSFR